MRACDIFIFDANMSDPIFTSALKLTDLADTPKQSTYLQVNYLQEYMTLDHGDGNSQPEWQMSTNITDYMIGFSAANV